MSRKIVGKFERSKTGRKWEYATIKLKVTDGWEPFMEYGRGPSLHVDGEQIVVTVRREIKR